MAQTYYFKIIMRLVNPITEQGFFWAPSKPEQRMPGTLSITDGGHVTLEIFEDFIGQGIRAFASLDAKCPPRFVGTVDGLGNVTLDGCWFKKRNGSLNGLTKSIVHVDRIVTNAHFSDDERFLFNRFRFTVDGIEEWLRLKAITTDFDEDYKGGTIKFRTPETIVLAGQFNCFSLRLDCNWTMPISVSSEAKVSYEPFLSIESNELRSIEDFKTAAFRVVQFLRLALGKPVSLSKVTISRDDYQRETLGGKTRPENMDFYYSSTPYSVAKPVIDAHSILFYFDADQSRTAIVLGKWFELFEQTEISLGLYFSTFAGDYKYLSNEFLALAQALETLHRRTTSAMRLPTEEFTSLSDSWIYPECTDRCELRISSSVALL